jgi:hypothetical protein
LVSASVWHDLLLKFGISKKTESKLWRILCELCWMSWKTCLFLAHRLESANTGGSRLSSPRPWTSRGRTCILTIFPVLIS